MAHKPVYISVDRLDALKLGKGILTDKELAERVGVYPSYIHKVKAQGRCRLATAERLAKVLGWGFVERSPPQRAGRSQGWSRMSCPRWRSAKRPHQREARSSRPMRPHGTSGRRRTPAKPSWNFWPALCR